METLQTSNTRKEKDTQTTTRTASSLELEERARLLVKESFEAVLKSSMKDGQLTTVFYERFFELSPAVRTFFAGADMMVLGKALAGIIVVMVRGLDDLEALLPKLVALGKRHSIYGVEEEHYAEVGPALLYAMEKVLGEPLPQEIKDAWCGVLDVVVGTMLQGHAMVADTEQAELKKAGGRRHSRMFVLKPRTHNTYYRLTRQHLVAFDGRRPVARAVTAYNQIRSMEILGGGKQLRLVVECDENAAAAYRRQEERTKEDDEERQTKNKNTKEKEKKKKRKHKEKTDRKKKTEKSDRQIDHHKLELHADGTRKPQDDERGMTKEKTKATTKEKSTKPATEEAAAVEKKDENADDNAKELVGVEGGEDQQQQQQQQQQLLHGLDKKNLYLTTTIVTLDHDDPEELLAWMNEIQWRISASRRGYKEYA